MTSEPLFILPVAVSVLALASSLAPLFSRSRGIPPYQAPPPPPAREQWYPLLAHELRVKTIYRHRVTGLKVWISRPGAEKKEAQTCGLMARGAMWNSVKGEWMDQSFVDNELETDDISLAPRALATWEKDVERHLKLP
jgi:hypothetical protein